MGKEWTTDGQRPCSLDAQAGQESHQHHLISSHSKKKIISWKHLYLLDHRKLPGNWSDHRPLLRIFLFSGHPSFIKKQYSTIGTGTYGSKLISSDGHYLIDHFSTTPTSFKRLLKFLWRWEAQHIDQIMMWWVLISVGTLLLTPHHKIMSTYRLQWAMCSSILRKRRTILYKITFCLYLLRVQDNWHFLCPKSRERKNAPYTPKTGLNGSKHRIWISWDFLPPQPLLFIPYSLSSLFSGILQQYIFFTKPLKRIYYSSTRYHVFISLLKLCFLSAKLRVIAAEYWLGFSLFDYC